MAYLKIRNKELEGYSNGKYHDDNSFCDVIGYVMRPEKTPSGYIGGIAVDVAHAVEQMEKLSAYYGQNTGVRLRHMILAFEPGELSNSRKYALSIAYQVAYPIALFYGDHHQIVYAVHEDGAKVHIHFVMNTTNYLTGLKYPGSKADYYQFLSHINQELADYYCSVVPTKDREDWQSDPF